MLARAPYYKQRVAFALSFGTAFMNLVAIRNLRTSYIKWLILPTLDLAVLYMYNQYLSTGSHILAF